MIKPGLRRILRLLDPIPTPWHSIHVAGTNGKGSVCAYINAMLNVYNKSGWREQREQPIIRSGMFTSPHHIDRWDCISGFKGVIRQSTFERIEAEVRTRNTLQEIDASEFEILTAVAFQYFTDSEVDLAIVECGMGGREDATNVLGMRPRTNFPCSYVLPNGKILHFDDHSSYRPIPLVAAITKIGSDHLEHLGPTFMDIVKHKAGIIKPGTFLVYDRSNRKKVITELEATARKTHDCKVIDMEYCFPGQKNDAQSLSHWLDKYAPGFDTRSLSPEKRNFFESTPEHTRFNTSVALRAVWSALIRLNRVPQHMDYSPNSSTRAAVDLVPQMIDSVKDVVIPGRQESINLLPLTGKDYPALLDGAHNLHSAKALANAVELQREAAKRAKRPSRVTWILGMSSSKDISSILEPLIQSGDRLLAVQFEQAVDGMPWVKAHPSVEILEAARKLKVGKVQVGNELAADSQDHGGDILGAINAAVSGATTDAQNIVVIAGSLYLVSEVQRMMKEAKGLHGGNTEHEGIFGVV